MSLLNAGGVVVSRADDQLDVLVIGGDRVDGHDSARFIDQRLGGMVASGKVEVVAEASFWQRVAMAPGESNVHSLYTTSMVAELAKVPLATVRRWEQRGLIEPCRRIHRLAYYDFAEVANARRLADMLAQGINPRQIEHKLSRLGSKSDQPLSTLSVQVDGNSILLRENGRLIEPDGQCRFDFSAIEECEQQAGVGGQTAESESLSHPNFVRDQDREAIVEDVAVVRFRQNAGSDAATVSEVEDQPSEKPPNTPRQAGIAELAAGQLRTPEQFLTLAMAFEDEGENGQAVEVYRAMQLALGPTPEVCFQLAELLYFDAQYEAARERYYMAIELDESFVEARANLGCAFIELGELEMAINAFQGALRYHSDYADVHFHLARTLDRMDRAEDAARHWHRYLQLAPDSPWSSEAKDRLSQTDDEFLST